MTGWPPPRNSRGPSPRSRATRRRSSKTSGTRSMRQRSCLIRRATCSCAPRPKNTSGTSTTAASPSCGAAAASSAACSWARSRKRSTRTRSSATCCSTPSSARPSRIRNAPGARSSPSPLARASRCRLSAPLWRSTTPIAASGCPPICLQAQRDYFGAHTYERIDQPRGQFFHTNWTGKGGTTASSTYTV